MTNLPTRIDAILDLFPITDLYHVDTLEVNDPISDNAVVYVFTKVPVKRFISVKKHTVYYSRINIEKLSSGLTRFSGVYFANLSSRSVDENWALIKRAPPNLLNTCVPKMAIRARSLSSWFTVTV